MEIYLKQLILLEWKSALHRKLKGLGIKNLIKMNIIICGAGRVGFTIAKLLGKVIHNSY